MPPQESSQNLPESPNLFSELWSADHSLQISLREIQRGQSAASLRFTAVHNFSQTTSARQN
jgi:hypothetical protein